MKESYLRADFYNEETKLASKGDPVKWVRNGNSPTSVCIYKEGKLLGHRHRWWIGGVNNMENDWSGL